MWVCVELFEFCVESVVYIYSECREGIKCNEMNYCKLNVQEKWLHFGFKRKESRERSRRHIGVQCVRVYTILPIRSVVVAFSFTQPVSYYTSLLATSFVQMIMMNARAFELNWSLSLSPLIYIQHSKVMVAHVYLFVCVYGFVCCVSGIKETERLNLRTIKK